nr:DnaT-like ssDNA-binding domain-containing protein [Spongiibacter thalassae]
MASTTKLVLLVISTYMDDHGGGAFPSTETIAANAGLSQRAVCTHIEKAVQAGFITVHKRRQRGRDWALNHYRIAFPPTQGTEPPSAPEAETPNIEGTERGSVPDLQGSETQANSGLQRRKNEALNDVQYLSRGTEPHARGTEPHDTEALNDVQSNSPMNSPIEPQQQQVTRAAFSMSLEWLPDLKRFGELLELRGLTPEMFSPEALNEFRIFWQADGRMFRQEQWEHKLINSLAQFESRRQRMAGGAGGTPSNFAQTYAQRQRAGVANDCRVEGAIGVQRDLTSNGEVAR